MPKAPSGAVPNAAMISASHTITTVHAAMPHANAAVAASTMHAVMHATSTMHATPAVHAATTAATATAR